MTSSIHLTTGEYDAYADWHRVPCAITDWLIVTGDLHPNKEIARVQLAEWQEIGVTDIIDVRIEACDKDFVESTFPSLRYHYLPTDDAGQQQTDAWFEAGLAIALDVRKRGGKVLIHCHMGINRAPSLAYRLLLELGEHPVEALDLIRAKRPIAGIAYADDAVSHYLRGQDATEIDIEAWVEAVTTWHEDKIAATRAAIHAVRAGENYR